MSILKTLLLIIVILLGITATSCSKKKGGTASGSSASSAITGPGLNIVTGQGETRITSDPVTTSQVVVNSSDLAKTGPWADQLVVSDLLFSGGYTYISFAAGTYSLAGTIVLNAPGRLYISHYVWSDSAALDVTVGTLATVNIAAGAANTGWQTTYLGTLGSGSHAITISSTTASLVTAYVDAIVAVGNLDSSAGLNGRRWWEQDHSHLLIRGSWGTNAPSGVFPYSVTGLTGTGAIYDGNAGDDVKFWVDVPVGGTLRIWSPKNPALGILGVRFDGVDQATYDQYAAAGSEVARNYAEYAIAAGYHEVQLYVTGTKNPASSANTVYIDAISIPMVSETDEARAIRLADYIMTQIRADDGGPRNSYDSDYYNQDNDAGYAGMALALAAARWNYSDHIAAVKRLIVWYANVMQADGVWHWGYSRNGLDDYEPWVGDQYTGLVPSITGLRSLDAAQSFPAVVMAIYASAFPEDTEFIQTYAPIMIQGIDALIANNYDSSNGFFFSSYQYYSGAWHLYEAQYSAGQADVYLGLMCAYALTGTQRYKDYAIAIKNNFHAAYWSSALNLYSVSLTGAMGAAKIRDDATIYAFAQGWGNWVFGTSNLTNGTDALSTMSTWVQGDGHSVLKPGDAEAQTNNSAFLAMGLKASGQDDVLKNALYERLRQYQQETYPHSTYGDNAIYFSDAYPYSYTSNAAWGFMVLTEQPSAQSWMQF
ncbi:MAG: hypothetical protein HYV97_02225 [Bdellovibrio sp.]|nr:hypothetical protein [Bdellovibrio sp.]